MLELPNLPSDIPAFEPHGWQRPGRGSCSCSRLESLKKPWIRKLQLIARQPLPRKLLGLSEPGYRLDGALHLGGRGGKALGRDPACLHRLVVYRNDSGLNSLKRRGESRRGLKRQRGELLLRSLERPVQLLGDLRNRSDRSGLAAGAKIQLKASLQPPL